jgi:hypothetical protein
MVPASRPHTVVVGWFGRQVHVWRKNPNGTFTPVAPTAAQEQRCDDSARRIAQSAIAETLTSIRLAPGPALADASRGA